MIAQTLNAEQLNEYEENFHDEGTAWSDLIPFDDYTHLPEYPVDVLPDVGKRMVSEVSEVAQVDAGLPGVLYLAVTSSCLGGKVTVNLKSHTEPCHEYYAVILPSGERKSSVNIEMSLPIYCYQNERQEEMRETIRDAINKQKVLEVRLAKLQKQAANAEDQVERFKLIGEAAAISKQLDDEPVPANPVYVIDDVTTEKLGLLMAATGERMAIISAEGGIFKLINGLYNDRDGNFDLYLKAHAGDPWSSHRIGRESTAMTKPALTMSLAIQPDVLDEIGQNKQFRGRGLLARFLFSMCKSQVGFRKRQTKALSESLRQEYKDHVYSLMKLPSNILLNFTPEAHKLWDEFYNDIEIDLRPGGALENMQDWGSKLPGAVARIAGQLHMATHGQEGIEKPISVNIVTGSCILGGYFREHALAAFNQMKADPRISTAKKILTYLNRLKPQYFKGRDVLRHAYFKNRTMDDVMPGINMLIERDYIHKVVGKYPGIGRPEADSYIVNPKFYEK